MYVEILEEISRVIVRGIFRENFSSNRRKSLDISGGVSGEVIYWILEDLLLRNLGECPKEIDVWITG